MRIAIDYDGTYTRDPDVFNKIITDFFDNCNSVVCVSSRRDTVENRFEIESAFWDLWGIHIPIYLTGYKAKAEFMDKCGKHIDIWIDDDPKTIDPNGVIDKPQYDEWKASGK